MMRNDVGFLMRNFKQDDSQIYLTLNALLFLPNLHINVFRWDVWAVQKQFFIVKIYFQVQTFSFKKFVWQIVSSDIFPDKSHQANPIFMGLSVKKGSITWNAKHSNLAFLFLYRFVYIFYSFLIKVSEIKIGLIAF